LPLLSECLYGLGFAFVLGFARSLLRSALFFLPSHALGFGPVHALLFNGRGYLFARDGHLAQTGVEFAPFSVAPRAANARKLARLEHETKAAGRRIVPLRRSPSHIRFLPS
jgi:hypothetical protein